MAANGSQAAGKANEGAHAIKAAHTVIVDPGGHRSVDCPGYGINRPASPAEGRRQDDVPCLVLGREHAPRRSAAKRGPRPVGVDEVTNARMIAAIREEAKAIVYGSPILTATA